MRRSFLKQIKKHSFLLLGFAFLFGILTFFLFLDTVTYEGDIGIGTLKFKSVGNESIAHFKMVNKGDRDLLCSFDVVSPTESYSLVNHTIIESQTKKRVFFLVDVPGGKSNVDISIDCKYVEHKN